MTLLPLMPNIDTDQAVILEEKKFLKRDGNTNSIMVRIVTTLKTVQVNFIVNTVLY